MSYTTFLGDGLVAVENILTLRIRYSLLRNAVGGGRVSDCAGESVTKMYSSTLLALRGGGWVSNLQKASVT